MIGPNPDMSISIKRRAALRYLASAAMACPLVGHAQASLLLPRAEGKPRPIAMNAANPPPVPVYEFAQRIRTDLPVWRKIVTDKHIKPD